MKTPILGSAYTARSVNAADNRMVNLYPEIVPDGGKEPAFLSRTPGLRKLAEVGRGPIRGVWPVNGYLYVVSGNNLYSVDSNWNSQLINSISGAGSVSMSDNGTQLFIAANGPSFIYNTSTHAFAPITATAFPGAVTVGFIDGYFVFNEPNSQRIWISQPYDGLAYDPLDFASAEGSPDNLVGLIVSYREIWLFGETSTEVWYNAGLADFPFTRIQGAFNEIGCVSPYCIAKMDNSVFWVGKDARGKGIVYRAKGYMGERISTHAIEWQIQQYGDLSDTIGYTYQQDGHSFYVLVFPAQNTTWVYDVATGAWHERASFSNGVLTRHRGNCQAVYNNEIVVGDYANGNIYALDLTKYDDYEGPQYWVRSWRALPTGQNDLNRSAQHSLQLDCETGVGLSGIPEPLFFDLTTESGDILITESGETILAVQPAVVGADPRVMLRWSDDGGHTWSNEHWKFMGRIGQYGYRTIWRRLGMTMKIRDRVYEVSGSDPVKIAIVGAELHISGTSA